MNDDQRNVIIIVIILVAFGIFKTLFWTVGIEGRLSAGGLLTNLGLLIVIIAVVYSVCSVLKVLGK